MTSDKTTVTELTLAEAWEMLKADSGAMLIDVRTSAEWNFVGVPDLSAMSKEPRCVEWTTYPDGAANPHFVERAAEGLDREHSVLLLCRSGARSLAAAHALIAAGYPSSCNVTAGFEGNLDDDGHRHGGWKDELPWRQG